MRLAESNFDSSFLCISIALEGSLIFEVIVFRLFAIAPIRVNFEIIEVFIIGLPLKILEDIFDFFLIKLEIVFRLLEETGKTVFEFFIIVIISVIFLHLLKFL